MIEIKPGCGKGNSPSPGSQSLADLSPRNRGRGGCAASSPQRTQTHCFQKKPSTPTSPPVSGERSARLCEPGEGETPYSPPVTIPIITPPFLTTESQGAQSENRTPRQFSASNTILISAFLSSLCVSVSLWLVLFGGNFIRCAYPCVSGTGRISRWRARARRKHPCSLSRQQRCHRGRTYRNTLTHDRGRR